MTQELDLPLQTNYIEIQLRQVRLNLLDDQNIQIQFAIISEENQIKQHIMINNIQDRSNYKLEYEQDDKNLQIILIDGGKQIGFSNQTLENLQIQQINEIKLVHEQIVVGILSIQFSKSQPISQLIPQQSQRLKEYLKETGLEKIFHLIFAEIMVEKINMNDVYKFAAKRLREIGSKIYSEKK